MRIFSLVHSRETAIRLQHHQLSVLFNLYQIYLPQYFAPTRGYTEELRDFCNTRFTVAGFHIAIRVHCFVTPFPHSFKFKALLYITSLSVSQIWRRMIA
jgi:hypothetical protein